METETETPAAAAAVDGGEAAELITVLEQATLTAKQLQSATSDPTRTRQLYNTLHSAHHHLSLFLSQNPPENSLSGNDNNTNTDPMQLEEADNGNGEEHNSKLSVDAVEERFRDCFIQNKRPKRPLSPAAAMEAERRRSSGGAAPKFDAIGTKLRSFDLIYQFHA